LDKYELAYNYIGDKNIMSFGGQFGYPGELNPTKQMLDNQSNLSNIVSQRHVDRAGDYARLQGMNNTPQSGHIGNLSRPNIPMQQPMQTDLNLPTQQPIRQAPPQNIPIEPKPINQSTTELATSGIKPNTDMFSSSMAALGKNESSGISNKKAIGFNDNDINDSLTSDDPIKFSNGIGEFKKYDDKDLSPDTPAGQFITKIDQKYLQGVDEKGNKTYECPLTKKPCGRKTFWDRLKQFFLTMTGHLDQKKAQENIAKYDRIDPITKSFDSQQSQVKANTQMSNPWESQNHISPYSNGGQY
jgi:hypothetical protein